MNPLTTLGRAALSLLEPWIVVLYGLSYVPVTIYRLLISGQYATLFSLAAFHDALYGTFWATVGPLIKREAETTVIPLLQGRIRGGHTHDEPVSLPLRGTVLEIGAGSGLWADVLARFAGPEAPERLAADPITAIYGVEPNAISVRALRARVKAVGLEDIYRVVPVGIESIHDSHAVIEPGSVDSIVSILSLCSIPEPEKNIKLLYRLLKPGGTFYVYEHVKSTRGGPLMSLYTWLINPFWKIPHGSCDIRRETRKYLEDAGSWQDFDLEPPPGEPIYLPMPFLVGTATKSRG